MNESIDQAVGQLRGIKRDFLELPRQTIRRMALVNVCLEKKVFNPFLLQTLALFSAVVTQSDSTGKPAFDKRTSGFY
jgi:hypothetical protein